MKKNLVSFILILAFFVSGCLGPKRINKWVDNHYGEDLSAKPKTKSDYWSVTSGLITDDRHASNGTTQTKNMLPLLFYWQFDYMNITNLNAKLPINTFISAFQNYANAKGLKQKLNGQKLQLSIDSIPDMFVLNDREHMVWVIYAYAWDRVSFRPATTPLVVSYKIMQGSAVTKSGTVTVANTDTALYLKFLQSVRKGADQYLDQYDANIQAMAKKAVDNIAAGL